MSERDLPELPDDVASLLDAARETPRAPDRERGRVARRLAITLGVAVPGASLAGASVVGRVWFAKVLGVTAFVALVGGAGVALRRDHPRAPSVPAAVARAGTSRAPARVEATVVAPHALQPALSPAPPTPAALAPATATPIEDHDRAMQDEVALLDRAMAALERDDVAGASAALSQHARRFPRGRLSPEREAMRVRCVVAGGDAAAAEAARVRFHQRYPRSVLGAAVDRAVLGAPSGE